MSWRTVIVTKNCKLDLRMNWLMVRSKDETAKIYLDEIDSILIETTMVSITAALMVELMKKKIRLVFCDESHNPNSELIPYYGCHDCCKKIEMQQNWKQEIKDELWEKIVQEKISNRLRSMLI